MCPNIALAVTMPLTATQKPLSNSGDYSSLEELSGECWPAGVKRFFMIV